MPSGSSTIVRVVAVVILVLAGAEIGLCAELPPNAACSFTRSPDDDAPSADQCLCCCTHGLVALPVPIGPGELSVAASPGPLAFVRLVPPASVYHPPLIAAL